MRSKRLPIPTENLLSEVKREIEVRSSEMAVEMFSPSNILIDMSVARRSIAATISPENELISLRM